MMALGELVICLGLVEKLACCRTLFQNLGSSKGRHLPVKENMGLLAQSFEQFLLELLQAKLASG